MDFSYVGGIVRIKLRLKIPAFALEDTSARIYFTGPSLSGTPLISHSPRPHSPYRFPPSFLHLRSIKARAGAHHSLTG
eukprot:scaffold208403_cov30-Tisochrysis_lutea.AAC.1